SELVNLQRHWCSEAISFRTFTTSEAELVPEAEHDHSLHSFLP
ncbi:hypothetical protein A2U01_0119243, partial [Trifolium medium]|nr:hypothetical protein [Trifolium medium]